MLTRVNPCPLPPKRGIDVKRAARAMWETKPFRALLMSTVGIDPSQFSPDRRSTLGDDAGTDGLQRELFSDQCNPLDLSHIPYQHRRSLGASLMPEAFAYGPWAKEAELINAFYQLGLKAFNEDRTMIEAQQKNINRSGNARMLTTSFDGALSQFRRMMDDLIRTESQQSNGAAIASSAG